MKPCVRSASFALVSGALTLLACSSNSPAHSNQGGASSTTTASGSSTQNAGGSSPSTCAYLALKPGQTGPHGLVMLYAAGDGFDGLNVVSLHNGDVYVADDNFFGSGPELVRVPGAGGDAGVVERLGSISPVTSTPTSIVFKGPGAGSDAGASADAGGADTSSNVSFLVAPFSDLTQTSVVASNVPSPSSSGCWGVVTDGSQLYWYTGSAIVSLPLPSGTVKTLVPGAQPEGGMVTQGNYLYWLDYNDDALERVSVAGGKAEKLADSFFGGPMAADDTAVYWADTSGGTVNKWVLGATTSTQIANSGSDPFNTPSAIAVNNGSVYWAQGFGCQTLYVSLAGGGVTAIASGFNSTTWIGVDATHIFVGDGNGIYRLDK